MTTNRSDLKWIANGNVLAWACFWVFGYLAITAPAGAMGERLGAGALALAGLVLGVYCYMRLMRVGFRMTGPNALPKHANLADEARS